MSFWLYRWHRQTYIHTYTWQDRSRRCKCIQSFDIFSNFDIFDTLTGNDASNQIKIYIIIFVISRLISVEIDTSLALFQKFYFWRPFWFFSSKTRSAILADVTNWSCWFSIANSGRQLSTFSAILKKIGAKLRPGKRVPQWKSAKWPPWRYRFRNVKIR